MEATTSTATGTSPVNQPVIRRILVPTDLTAIADVAIEVSLDLARRTGAGIDVLTVLGPIEGDAYSPVQYSPEASVRQEDAEDLIKQELEQLTARHNTHGVQISATTRKGRPLSTIVARAEQFDADLIVLGTHDRGRLQHFLIGSAAEEIVRRAPCSTLVVHEQDFRPAEHLKRILVPIDLSNFSLGLVQYAHYLAKLYDARIDLLHVIEPTPLLDTLAGAMTIRDVVPDMKRRVTTEIEKLLEHFESGEITHDVHVVEGRAASQILAEASRQRSSMIVVGKQGRSAIERFLVGSVTERVVRHAPCQVLVARVAAFQS